MAVRVHVEVRPQALQVLATGLVQFDDAEVHLTVPYESVRAVRVAAYEPPQGVWRLGAGEEVRLADVHAGHYPLQGQWVLAAFEHPERVLVVDLEDFDFALRPYRRLVLEVDDPEATRDAIRGHAAAAADAEGDAPVAWMAIARGDRVLDRNGRQIGTVEHPLGDLEEDVFEGVAIRLGLTGGSHMAPPDAIARIAQGEVTLALDAEEARSLPPVVLEDLREAAPGRGIFRHPGWRRSSHWDDGSPR